VTAQEEYLKALRVQEGMQEEFVDEAGEPIRVGSIVRYAHDRRTDEYPDNVWNPERLGVVTGLSKTPAGPFAEEGKTHDFGVRVAEVDVTDSALGRWGRDDWYCSPESLVVIK
jgi:hypothetical protein